MLESILKEDLQWIIEDAGEPITVMSKDGLTSVEGVSALIRRNTEDAPPYGYDRQLSGKHHEVSFLKDAINAFPLEKGIKLMFDNSEFVVDHIFPSDQTLVTVFAR